MGVAVVTGLSGSGKSSLAFDTIYAEGQRRYMESLSSFAKRFITQVAKPDVDFVFGLSPVISIEQKTVASNPRSTVGTMTDIAGYLNLLFATVGQPHCPRTGEPTPARTSSQIVEAILGLSEGAEVELRAPVFQVYGEELDYVFTVLRKKGCRRMVIDGKPVDLAGKLDLDETQVRAMDAVVDRFVVGPKHEKAIKAGVASALLVGDGLMPVNVARGAGKTDAERFYQGLCSPTHHFVHGDVGPEWFVFNNRAWRPGSTLMGMLYVLDDPSIGLHPKDNVKMIATLERLRDVGNRVIVVEHDEDTIRAADHVVEMGPGPGVHGGTVVVQGTLDDLLACPRSPTGQFLSGKRAIPTPPAGCVVPCPSPGAVAGRGEGHGPPHGPPALACARPG